MKYFLMCVRRGAIAFSVLLGPTLISLAASAVYAGFQPDGADGLPFFAFIATAATLWALLGITNGPSDTPRWFFMLVSVLNMLIGIAVGVSDEKYHFVTAAVYLVFSLWQFFIARTPRVRIVS